MKESKKPINKYEIPEVNSSSHVVNKNSSIMSSLINMGGSGPSCSLIIINEKGYFENNDEVKGSVEIKAPNMG